MKTGFALAIAVLVGSAIMVGQMSAMAVPDSKSRDSRGGHGGNDGGVAGTIGPDVIVGSLPQIVKLGSAGDISAYAIGTTSCNIGDEQLLWQQNTSLHPVITQNLYRFHDGRFEMIGMSWLKHGFCALQQSLCGPCQPAGDGCPQVLGVGCSDPYGAALNGQQNLLGPRSEVNASTGVFPYPFSAPPPPLTIGRRLQVRNDDIDPVLNPGAIFFAEGMYVHPQDAAAGNAMNNASYRRVNVGSFSSGGWLLSVTGPTVQQLPAIHAWQAIDSEVGLSIHDVADDGRFILGHRVYDNGDGTWDYEFALYNHNSHRSADSFSVPVPPGVTVSHVGHHSIAHHSGEPYDTAPWEATVGADSITWATTPFETDENANALRWNTMFNFRFTADVPPQAGAVNVDLFRPGTPATAEIVALVPSLPETSCPSDLDGDGVVDGADLGALLVAWGSAGGPADLNGDGIVDGADLGALLNDWGNCD